MQTTLIVMTLNEIEGMKAIMPQVDRAWCDQILVVDGGSTDGTIEWARENGYEVYVQRQKGIRNGYLEAWPLVRGDVVITFSPDGNCVPGVIPDLIAKMKEGYDMVVASRYLGDAHSDDDDLLTGFGNWFFTNTINVLYRGHYTDVMGIYRAYKKDLVHKLDLDSDRYFSFVEKLFNCGARGLSWEPFLSMLAHKYGYRLAEVPGSEPARLGGKRKLRVFSWGGAIYLQFLLEFFRPRDPLRIRQAEQAPKSLSGERSQAAP
jgi:glycosyltransferase involved in cell wall biosynthesis